MAGEWRPGCRLDLKQLAAELGTSTSPVRDSLNRLAGERMVEFHAGLGFHVARIDESQLRDLLDLNLQLLLIAMRSKSGIQLCPVTDNLDDDSAQVFRHLAQCVGNGEITAAIGGISDRLAAIRKLEPRVLPEANANLQELVDAIAVNSDWPVLAKILTKYHRERMACIVELVRLSASAHD